MLAYSEGIRSKESMHPAVRRCDVSLVRDWAICIQGRLASVSQLPGTAGVHHHTQVSRHRLLWNHVGAGTLTWVLCRKANALNHGTLSPVPVPVPILNLVCVFLLGVHYDIFINIDIYKPIQSSVPIPLLSPVFCLTVLPQVTPPFTFMSF